MEELHFKSSGDPEITVALAGIHKLDWIKQMTPIKDAAVQHGPESTTDERKRL